MVKRDEEFFVRLLATFRIEADEHLQNMINGLIKLEKAEDSIPENLLEDIYREAHSLKGAARAVSLTDIESVCQSIESVFSLIKKKQIEKSKIEYDLLLHTFNLIEKYLNAKDDSTLAGIKNELSVCKASLSSAVLNAKEALSRNNNISKNDNGSRSSEYAVTEDPIRSKQFSNNKSELRKDLIEEKLSTSGSIRISGSKLDNLLLQAEELMSVKLTTNQHVRELKEVQSGLASWQNEWKKLQPELRSLKSKQVLERVSCLGNDKNVFIRFLNFLDWNHSQISMIESKTTTLLKRFKQDDRNVGGMVDGLLTGMKSAMMLPMNSMFRLYPKVIRDLSEDLGRSVDLIVEGAEIEVDRRILEQMKDPFLHLLRNCIDHGIERSEERLSSGKSVKGIIRISVVQTDSNMVEISFEDDGRGIDAELVKKDAIRKKIITEEISSILSEEEAINLIFKSDVSTSPAITDISGRGLGLAIVEEKVGNLNGTINVESSIGKGTKFRIQLPLTLATFRGVLVSTADRKFIVPTIDIERVRRVPVEEIKTVENKETIIHDSVPVSLVKLEEVLGISRLRDSQSWKHINVLILSHSSQKIAFAVDEVLNEQEILVKPFSKQLSRVKNIAGATILGSGKIVPILNVADLFKSAVKISTSAVLGSDRTAPSESGNRSVLVVDDSITSRMLIKDILESAGYKVKTSIDGLEALTTLKTEMFDLVVSDIEMPRMDGFELTKNIRGDKKLSAVPVVLVTALASQMDRERGIDSGADAYIVKSDFDQSNLLEIIQRLI